MDILRLLLKLWEKECKYEDKTIGIAMEKIDLEDEFELKYELIFVQSTEVIEQTYGEVKYGN